jgi:hypothetical protein
MEENCPICYSLLEARGGKPILTLGCCGLFFHQECINKVTDRKCPQCRAPFGGENQVDQVHFLFELVEQQHVIIEQLQRKLENTDHPRNLLKIACKRHDELTTQLADARENWTRQDYRQWLVRMKEKGKGSYAKTADPEFYSKEEEDEHHGHINSAEFVTREEYNRFHPLAPIEDDGEQFYIVADDENEEPAFNPIAVPTKYPFPFPKFK